MNCWLAVQPGPLSNRSQPAGVSQAEVPPRLVAHLLVYALWERGAASVCLAGYCPTAARELAVGDAGAVGLEPQHRPQWLR